MVKPQKMVPISELKQPYSVAIQRAIASLKLEGINLSSDTLEDVQLYEAGMLSKDEFVARAVARAKSHPN